MGSYEKILLAEDFSSGSERALPFAVDVAKRCDAELLVVHVDVMRADALDEADAPVAPVQKLRERLRTRIQRKSERLPYDPGSLRLRHKVIRDPVVASALIRFARSEEADLIVLGTRGEGGFDRLLLGSVASEVVRSATCHVLTVGPEASIGAEKERPVLAPVDFSPPSLQGLQVAKEWAEMYGAPLELLHTMHERVHPDLVPPSQETANGMNERLREQARKRLQEFAREAGIAGEDDEISYEVRIGDAGRAIARRTQEESFSFVVMATGRASRSQRFALGSVAEKTVRLATCPVLTVRLHQEASDAPASEKVQHAS